jgi:hypothetical protein
LPVRGHERADAGRRVVAPVAPPAVEQHAAGRLLVDVLAVDVAPGGVVHRRRDQVATAGLEPGVDGREQARAVLVAHARLQAVGVGDQVVAPGRRHVGERADVLDAEVDVQAALGGEAAGQRGEEARPRAGAAAGLERVGLGGDEVQPRERLLQERPAETSSNPTPPRRWCQLVLPSRSMRR